MKKLALIVLVAFCAASAFAGGQGSAAQTDMEVFEVTTFGWAGVDYSMQQDAFDYVKETFGLDIDMTTMAGMGNPGDLEKPELMWISGDYPHFFDNYYQRIEGFGFAGIWDKIRDIKPLVAKIPNIRSWFSDFEWNDMVGRRSLPNGKLPYIPGHNYRTANTSWCYEATTFENLGIDAPNTLDDLYKALQVLRAEYTDPSYFLIGARENFFGIFNGIAFANRTYTGFNMGADNISMGEPYYYDPDTKELTFGATTEKYLNSLKYAKKLMDEGLAPDMTTRMDEGIFWNEAAKNLKLFISFGPTKDEGGNYDNAAVANFPDVNWIGLWTPITAYPDKVALVPYSPPDWDNGVFITDKVTDGAMLDQVLKYIDFLGTKREGSYYALESMFVLDEWLGRPAYEINTDPKVGRVGGLMNPKEWPLPDNSGQWKYDRSPYFGEHWTEEQYVAEYGGPRPGWYPPTHYPIRTPFTLTIYQDYDPMFDYAESVKAGAGEFTKTIVWTRTPEEDTKLRELETAMAVIVNNFLRDFLNGEVSEAAWDDYKRDLQKAGLDEAFAIRKVIYDRNNK